MFFPVAPHRPSAEAVLGPDCVLEPSFAAFKLDHRKTAAHTSYVGNNFSRPHRDYSYADSIEGPGEAKEAAGAEKNAGLAGSAGGGGGGGGSEVLKVLSVWVPLNAVTARNGCMYAVPRGLDAGFADPAGAEGLRTPAVPAEGVAPLAPHPPGTLMCWTGNTVHWGGGCEREGAADPRQSVALVFRRRGVRLSVAEASLSRADVAAADTAARARWCQAAVGFFKHWYPASDLAFRLPGAS